MKFEIKSRWNGSVLFSLETSSLKICLEAAAKSKANLFGANLFGANLSGANLSKADLLGADLFGADLSGANLSEANLSWANLFGANLSKANLLGANLGKTGLDPNKKPNGNWKRFKPLNKDWVIGYRTRETSGAGKILVDDRIYGVEVFSTLDTECHPGWYLWPSLEEAKSFSGEGEEFIKVKSRKKDIHKAGSKWRSQAIWVLGTVK